MSNDVTSGTLDGACALVTGGAGGIGAAVAAALAEGGARVVVLDRDGDAAAKVAADVRGHTEVADLTDAADLAAAVDRVEQRLGPVQVLVNNAGAQHVAPVTELDPATWQRLHDLMLRAPFLLSQRVLPGMYAAGWGRLVHVSSVHGLRASAYKSAYVSAKHGLEGLSKVIALESAGTGVTSNTVCPGYVRTPLVEGQVADQAREHGISPDRVVDEVLLARTPVKRMVEPAEVAAAVAWLCGPHSASVTGSAQVLDGGWTAA